MFLRALRPVRAAPALRGGYVRSSSSSSSSSSRSSSSSSSSSSDSSSDSSSSSTPTLKFEECAEGNPNNLPRLPVPPLPDTIARYLRSAAALSTTADPVDFAAHEALVHDFGATAGRALHEAVAAKDAADAASGGYPRSYIESDWDDMYYGGRWSLPINSNPYFVLKELPPTDMSSAHGDAARLVTAAVQWHLRLLAGDMPLDGGCVSQLQLQFGTGRVAREGRCVLASAPRESAHVVVLCGGLYYKLQVLEGGGRRGEGALPQGGATRQLSAAALAKQLDAIRAAHRNGGGAGATPPPPPLAALTTQGRDEWGAQREAMEAASAVNRASLREIDTALLVITLDGAAPADLEEAAASLLHGGSGAPGCDYSAGARWYDKHGLVVFENGKLGVNFEHSFSDGMTWNAWIGEAWSHCADPGGRQLPAPDGGFVEGFGGSGKASGEAVAGLAAVPLLWELGEEAGGEQDGPYQIYAGDRVLAGASSVAAAAAANSETPLDIVAAAKAAAAAHAETASGLQTAVLEFGAFGKAEIKKWGMSPDAAAQMAFALAFYRMHAAVAPVYESCSTRGFLHGRTETIRVATPEAAAWAVAAAEAWAAAGGGADATPDAAGCDAVCAALGVGATAHLDNAKAAVAGNGVDRHLTAMQSLAADMPVFQHPLFEDELFSRSRSWRISSSNVTAPFLELFGFGPVVGDGYGVGYMIQQDSIPVSITAFGGDGGREGDATDAKAFAQGVGEALHFMARCQAGKTAN